MQKLNHYYWCLIPALLFFEFVYPINSFAQPFSVRASVGFVHLPLSDWSNFFSEHGTYYQKNNPNTYFALSLYYSFSDRHYLELGTELIKSSASLSDMATAADIIDWKFQGIPVTLGYEYRFPVFNEYFTPAAGLGASYFFSEVIANEHYFQTSGKRTGNGYGLHASAAIISRLSESLSVTNKVRYRYSNGMAFSDKSGDIKVEFTGFDISMALGWTF